MTALLDLPHVASRLFGTPLLIHQPKLDVILRALEPRLLGHAAPALAESEDERDERPREATVKAEVATVPVLGTLVHRKLGMAAMSGVDSTQQLRSRIEAALADEGVRGILLEVDSPGGEAAGIFDLADVIFEGRAKKPIVAFVNERALSAGYAIASAADAVVVPRTGMVGSVGVVAMHVDQSRLNEKVGLKPTFVYAGDKKIDGNAHEPLSERARTELQAEIDKLYSLFVETVARNRSLTTEAVRATQAGVLTGEDAKARGFANAVGGREDALSLLRQLMDERNTMKVDEKQFAALQAEFAELKASAAAKDAALAEAKEMLATLQAEREAQRAVRLDAVVEGVVATCEAAGATGPDAAERARIREALEKDEDLGRFVAATVQERCLTAARMSKATVKTLDPGKSEDDDRRKKFVEGIPSPAAGKKE